MFPVMYKMYVKGNMCDKGNKIRPKACFLYRTFPITAKMSGIGGIQYRSHIWCRKYVFYTGISFVWYRGIGTGRPLWED